MLRTSWILFAAFLSFSATAASVPDMYNRIQVLKNLSENAPALNVEAFERSLEYEKAGLSLEEQAQAETSLLTNNVRSNVNLAYQAAFNRLRDPEAAYLEVEAAINHDLELADPSSRDELSAFAIHALKDSRAGRTSEFTSLTNTEQKMLKNVSERSSYLTKEQTSDGPVDDNKNLEKRVYANKHELVARLVAEGESTRWVSTANMNVRSTKATVVDGKIKLQLKISFLGSKLEAGPYIAFSRTYSTTVNIMTESLEPILLGDGTFEFYKRDTLGRILTKNGKPVRRFAAFYCEAELNFASEAGLSGEFVADFSIAGIGSQVTAEASGANRYSNSVVVASRRVLIPEYVAGETVTMPFLIQLCQKDFLAAGINRQMTVKDSLNTMMKNIVAGIRYSHPKTKCATDEHCVPWMAKNVISLMQKGNFARCVEEKREKYFTCEMRGLENQTCPVIKNGKKISGELFEFNCDTGLQCVQTRKAGWVFNLNIYETAKGICKPINKSTYQRPHYSRD